ncbi:zinc finger protein 613-like [Armigeres subalbatus]|uniref:zinc finger protein 613-like n=1 Tax=Armigeres subalbatus TaxID=124917 RepID=UPI002ED38827
MKQGRTLSRRSRGTQVDPQDIEMFHVRCSDLSNSDAENKPIAAFGVETIVPQCRLCSRRVSRENLKIFLRSQCKKVHAAFQIRVFHNDLYPWACSNCLNMIDIFLDYKSSVVKARNLLLDRRIHLEGEGWDDPVNIESFEQCKSAIEQHRVQIDALYEECLVNEERRQPLVYGEHIMEEEDSVELPEPKIEFSMFEENVPADETMQSTITPNAASDVCTVELAIESDMNEVEYLLETDIEDYPIENVIEVNTDEATEVIPVIDITEDEGQSYSQAKRAKKKKVEYRPESDQNAKDVIHNSDEIHRIDDDDRDSILQQISTNQELSVKEEIISEESVPVKRKYKRRVKQQDQVKKQTKVRKLRKPKQPRKRQLNRPPQIVLPTLCDLCGQSVRPETIEGHKNRHLGIKPYKCPFDGCDWSFHGRSNMCTHIRRVHPKNGIQSHECNVCGKIVRGMPGTLNEHKRLHFLEKSHVCPVCGKGFTLSRYLRQHAAIHTGQLPYECSFCGKKFNNKWSMKTHEKNMHMKKNQVIPLNKVLEATTQADK